jgi:hypothetical protein
MQGYLEKKTCARQIQVLLPLKVEVLARIADIVE